MLSHLLHLRGVESVVVDIQARDAIEQTIKAGILEQGTVDLMRQTGVGDRMMRDGFVHHGINLAFEGGIHRINLTELSGGRSVTVYAQHEVLKDLIAKRLEDGGDVRFGVTDTKVDDFLTDQPRVSFTYEGRQESLECDFVIGADGSRTMCRFLIPQPEVRTDFFRQYPFAWFGILAEAPPSSDELIYAHSERGFVLISTRSPAVQRLYFQCDPETNVDDWC
jgi:p-hydroxybenzoate 3-monooxygenase